MVLVTGAGGKTGQAVVSKLIDKNLSVRAWLTRPSVDLLGADHFIGDMLKLADWEQACAQ